MKQLASRLFFQLINLRTIMAGFLIALALVGTPQFLDRPVGFLNTHIVKLVVDFVDLPQPKAAVTIVHVPDIDFDAWLADIAGARRLHQLIDRVDPQFAIGFVTEEPLRFIQSSTDKLVDAWSDKSSIRPQNLKDELKELSALRQQLLELLRERVIIGMPLRGSAEGRNVPWTPLDTASLPPWLALYLWGLPPSSATFDIPAVAAEHSPISPPGRLVAELLHFDGEGLREGFALRLLRQSQSGKRFTSIQWHQYDGLTLEGTTLTVGYDAQYVSLYGKATGIAASATRLTLDAALRLETVTGNLLIGRDGDLSLEHAAQNFMALGDGAYWITAEIYPLMRMALLAFLVVAVAWLWAILPGWVSFASIIAFQIIGLVGQALLVRIYGQWIPLADVYIALWTSGLIMAIWHMYARQRLLVAEQMARWRLRTARLEYRAGNTTDAAKILRDVSVTPKTLRLFYRVAERLEAKNYHREALEIWHCLPKRLRKFRDVAERMAACNNAIAAIQHPPNKPDQTQVICVNTSLEKLGRYEIRGVLGHGGSGVVYRGFDPIISRDVALKTLNLNMFRHESRERVKQRFIGEVKTVGRLTHPNIVTVYDVGEHDYWAYIAMDLVKGKPLSEYIKPDSLLPIAEVYWVGLKVAEALAFAHAQNIVHCDIKPGNIIYDRETQSVKVTDFGIAQWLDAAQTETGEVQGSPLYMAPEQLQGRPVSPQTDIFSLGATLYQLLAGRPPFTGRSIAEIQQAVLHAKPLAVRNVRDGLPPSAARIVNGALKKPVAERYKSASDLAFTLNKALMRDFKEYARECNLFSS